jgi:hypothetical protein
MNMEIELYDRKLHTMTKAADNEKIIQANLIRSDFTHAMDCTKIFLGKEIWLN